jgi:small subunit ribosomal protein S20
MVKNGPEKILPHAAITTPEDDTLANHKSAIKRNKQSKARNLRNTHVRSTMRTLVKQVRTAVAGGDADAARQALTQAIPYIDKAVGKGVIHKATASRKISRLNKLVNTLS